MRIDERTEAVEYASYKWAYIFITFALFIDVIYRGAMRNEAAWDLMALAVAAAAVSTIYQARQNTVRLDSGALGLRCGLGCSLHRSLVSISSPTLTRVMWIPYGSRRGIPLVPSSY